MENKINLKLDFNQEQRIMCIEFPGVVKDKTKMFKTLGGKDHIQEVYNNIRGRLDLRFRPEDPNCKPVCGDRTLSTSLLLNVKKYRKRKVKSDDKNIFMYKQSIVGVIDTTYKFSTLCDFQYLSVRKDQATGEFVNMIPNIQINELNMNCKTYRKDAPLFLPPQTFSRFDTPQDYSYKKMTKVGKYRRTYKEKVQEEVVRHSLRSRPRRLHNAICVSYEDAVPTEPTDRAVSSFKNIFFHLEDMKAKTEELFQERPIWSKNAILAKLGMDFRSFKAILPMIAFYFSSGPWRLLWVKYGYDPRTHRKAQAYQLIEFRLRKGMNLQNVPIKAKRSTFNYMLPNLKNQTPVQKIMGNEVTDKENKEASYIYRPMTLPQYRQTFYQACDIMLPEAQELLQKQMPFNHKCMKDNGWFYPNTAKSVRDILSKDLYKTLAQMHGSSAEAVQSIDMFRDKSRRRTVPSHNSRRNVFPGMVSLEANSENSENSEDDPEELESPFGSEEDEEEGSDEEEEGLLTSGDEEQENMELDISNSESVSTQDEGTIFSDDKFTN